jgi:hypothetical protein
MPNDRLLRYSIAGVSFIFFLLFFQYIFGRNIDELFSLVKGDDNVIILIITFLLSAPVLGIIISTVIFQILWLFLRMKMYFTLPCNEKVEEWVLEDLTLRREEIDQIKELRNKNLNNEGRPRNGSKYMYRYFPYYQIKVRKHIKGENLVYLERKLAVYYVHLNILGTIVLGLICGLFYVDYSWPPQLDCDGYKIGGIIFLVLYVAGAMQIVISAFKHATDFEHAMLESAYKVEKSKIIKSKV